MKKIAACGTIDKYHKMKARMNPLEYDHYPYEEKKEHGPVYKIFKWAAILLVVGVYLILFFRMCSKEDPASAKEFLWTENTLTAYEKWQNADTATRGDFAYTQESSHTIYNEQTRETKTYRYDTFSCRENSYSGDGNNPEDRKKYIHYGQFHTSNPIYIPSAGEVQITIRVNDEGMEELMKTYNLSTLPQGEVFAYALTDGENVYTDYQYTTSDRFTYNYHRLTFSGVDFTDLYSLELLIFYVGDGTVDLANPYEYLTVYLADIPMKAYNMKDAKPVKLTDLQKPPYVVYNDSTKTEE